MSATPLFTNRMPNLPVGPMVDKDGNPTSQELVFRQNLTTNLLQLFGNDGCVVPTQTADNIITIQNNQLANGQYTCAFGTIIYNSTANSIMIAIDGGGGVPLFKTVTLT